MEIGSDLDATMTWMTISTPMPTDRTNLVLQQKITVVKKNLTKENFTSVPYLVDQKIIKNIWISINLVIFVEFSGDEYRIQ